LPSAPTIRWNLSRPSAGFTQPSPARTSKGKLIPGYEADFILVDRNLYTVGAPAILRSVVLETFVAGQEASAANIKAQ
jgi:hypothetical protein